MVWFIPIPSATSPYPHQIIAQGYPVQSCQRAADPEWFIFSGPAYVLSAIAILCTAGPGVLYSVQCIAYSRGSTWTGRSIPRNWKPYFDVGRLHRA